jgi:hypothetical protein
MARRRRERAIDGVAWPPELAGTDPRVLDGLRDWLHACLAGASSQFVTLPSAGVATAWTTLAATDAWPDLCDEAFGERMAPGSSEGLSPTRRRDGLWRTWTILSRREGIDDVRPDRLPRLFAVDSEARVPGGVTWAVADASPPFRRTSGPEPHVICAVPEDRNADLLYAPWGNRRWLVIPPG